MQQKQRRPYSKAQIEAARKWDGRHMATCSCRIPKPLYKQFRQCAAAHGCTAHSLLRRYVRAVVAREAAAKAERDK